MTNTGKEDKPFDCAGVHVWEAFLSHNHDLNFGACGYYRICMNCGKIEYRDKTKEWNKHLGGLTP